MYKNTRSGKSVELIIENIEVDDISITVQLMQTLFQMRGMRQVYTRFPVRQIVQRRQSDTLNNGTL